MLLIKIKLAFLLFSLTTFCKKLMLLENIKNILLSIFFNELLKFDDRNTKKIRLDFLYFNSSLTFSKISIERGVLLFGTPSMIFTFIKNNFRRLVFLISDDKKYTKIWY